MIHSIAWRKSSERVAMAQEILNHGNTSAMLAVLELDHPAKNIPKVEDGFGSTRELGIIIGYERCLSMLRDLGKPAPLPIEAVHATWGADEEQTK